MSIRNLLRKQIRVLKELIRYLKMLYAVKRAEKNPGRKEVIRRIRVVANKFGIDEDLAIKVAHCESSLNPLAVRRNPAGSIDRGLYQWNDYYHPEVSNKEAFNIEHSTYLFCQAVASDNLRWWYSSKHCWGQSE